MVKDFSDRLTKLHLEFANDSWSHPRTLVFLVVISKILDCRHFFEIGTWKGSVPIMLKRMEKWFDINQFQKITLVENFQDFDVNDHLASSENLLSSIQQKIGMPVDIDISRIIKKPLTQIDAIHFDSTKWQYMLIDQFTALKKYCSTKCVFVFDDYIAEWPDVIHCVNEIITNHELTVVGTFGPKIYVTDLKNKQLILGAIQDMGYTNIFNIRHSIDWGDIVSSGPDLMI